MVNWLSDWAGAIIIAVIISTIIEMLLPEGNSKKYIKVVVGVYILFTIISPVITKVTGKSLDVSDLLELDMYINEIKQKETSQNLLQQNNSASIRDIYIGNLKADIQSKLKGKGYIATSIELEVGTDENYTLHRILLSLNKDDEEGEKIGDESANKETDKIQTINEINISVSNTQLSTNETKEEKKKSNLDDKEKKKVKEYLSSVYEINERNIVIEQEISNFIFVKEKGTYDKREVRRVDSRKAQRTK